MRTDLPPGLPLVSFDAVLIERVLSNLFVNAAKYTPPGSCVTIAPRVHGNDLRVSVADDGPGLPAGRKEALFEKFARGERESATPGVGLGLAICRAIFEANGGRIWFEAAEASATTARRRGAQFRFTLPLGTPLDMPADEGAESALLERLA